MLRSRESEWENLGRSESEILESRSRKFWKVGFGSRIFYLRLRNPAQLQATKSNPKMLTFTLFMHLHALSVEGVARQQQPFYTPIFAFTCGAMTAASATVIIKSS